MTEAVAGMETEYKLDARSRRTGQPCKATALEGLMTVARRDLPHFPGLDCGGIFLPAGRLYQDMNLLPEFATAECMNPWDVVRYVAAGELILDRLARSVTEESADLNVSIFRCNVDYWNTHATWGCHESYSHRFDPRRLPGDLIPHLLSRPIYTGAGGFNSKSAGLEFTLTPRSWHMTDVVSGNSTRARGIYHTKDETLSGGACHRLHVIFGESLCSHRAIWLKTGATSLVVALAGAGLNPGADVQLADPLEAMRIFAADPTCKATAKTVDGGDMSAVDIQRVYQQMATRHKDAPFMPPWAPQVCESWGDILQRLSDGAPGSVVTTLDWAMKLALFSSRAQRAGIAWESLPKWNYVLGRLHASFARRQPEYRMSLHAIIGPGSRIADRVRRVMPIAEALGLCWDDLGVVLRLRSELCELDTRFGQLGEEGIFNTMDRSGALDHAVEGVDNIEHAITNGPRGLRGEVRGKYIRKLSSLAGRYRCNWQRIADSRRHRMIDLTDPFATEAAWQNIPIDAGMGGELGVLQRTRRQRHVRRVRRRLQRRDTPVVLQQGDRVIIADLFDRDMPVTLFGALAGITAVEGTAETPLYRLNVDAGQFEWTAEALCLVCRPGRG